MNIWYGVEKCDSDCKIAVFRNTLTIGPDGRFECTFSADECADIFIDGQWVEYGPQRGDKAWWYSEDIQLQLTPGRHIITVRLLMFGSAISAAAQVSVAPGIFMDSKMISGSWEYYISDACSFFRSDPDWGNFPAFEISEDYNYQAIEGKNSGWKNALPFNDDRVLHAPDIPHWICRKEENYRILEEPSRKLVIFKDYVRCKCEYRFSGCGEVRLLWSEAPFDDDLKKRKREDWDLCRLPGKPSILKFNGNCRWVDYHYRTGRCLQIECSGNVKLDSIEFTSLKYPYSKKWQVKCSFPAVEKILDIAWNTFDMCSFDTFMDCPYYEQMQYVGDIRIECLVSYVTEHNTALPVKALRQLGRSTDLYGVTLSRHPSHQEQLIPSFALVWILCLEDYAKWQGASLIPDELEHARQNIAFFDRYLDRDGLPDFPGWDRISGWEDKFGWDGINGWNFLDWHDSLFRGIPRGNAPLAVLYVLALESMARLEELAGNCGEKYRKMAQHAAENILKRYYLKDRNLLADDHSHQLFSEHPQIFSVLTDSMPDCELDIKDGIPAGIYFSHYFLEAAYKKRDASLFWKRFSQWFSVFDEQLKTLPEEFTHPRSDCHAWSSHVLYHYFASILGIRPRCVERNKWNIDPLPVDLDFAQGKLTHSTGDFFVSWEKENGAIIVNYDFPENFSVYHKNSRLPASKGSFKVKI